MKISHRNYNSPIKYIFTIFLPSISLILYESEFSQISSFRSSFTAESSASSSFLYCSNIFFFPFCSQSGANSFHHSNSHIFLNVDDGNNESLTHIESSVDNTFYTSSIVCLIFSYSELSSSEFELQLHNDFRNSRRASIALLLIE